MGGKLEGERKREVSEEQVGTLEQALAGVEEQAQTRANLEAFAHSSLDWSFAGPVPFLMFQSRSSLASFSSSASSSLIISSSCLLISASSSAVRSSLFFCPTGTAATTSVSSTILNLKGLTCLSLLNRLLALRFHIKMSSGLLLRKMFGLSSG